MQIHPDVWRRLCGQSLHQTQTAAESLQINLSTQLLIFFATRQAMGDREFVKTQERHLTSYGLHDESAQPICYWRYHEQTLIDFLEVEEKPEYLSKVLRWLTNVHYLHLAKTGDPDVWDFWVDRQLIKDNLVLLRTDKLLLPPVILHSAERYGYQFALT